MTKWTAEIDDGARMAEFVSRAFHQATAGRPGPVVLALPEDMLSETVEIADAPAWRPVETVPSAEDHETLSDLLAAAQRPVLIIGGTRWDVEASAHITRFAESHQLPVVTSYRRLPLFDALHPNYAGDLGIGPNPKLMARLKASDLIILAGGKLGEIPSQAYGLLDIPGPNTKLVHIYPDPMEIGRVYVPAPRHQCFAQALCAGTRIAKAAAFSALGGKRCRGPCRISRMDRESHATARRRQPRRGHGLVAE